MKIFETTKLNQFKEKFLMGKDYFTIGLFLLLGFIAFLQFLNDKKTDSISPQEELAKSIDTYIPKGYVLIPLELKNHDSISGIISDRGIVDLYVGEKKSSQLAAKTVKIVRAPLNPNLFAALMTEHDSQNFLKFDGPFTAVIKNQQTVENENINNLNTESKFKPKNVEYFQTESETL